MNLNKKTFQSNKFFQFLLPILLAFSFSTVHAQVKRHFVFDTIPTNLEDQAKLADRIIHGEVVSKIKKKKADSELQYNEVKIKVTEWIKPKNNKADFLTVKIWDATAHAFTFDVGDEVIAAFHPNSKLGLTTPVAVGDGLYKVSREDSKGIVKGRVAINKNKNLSLTRNYKSRELINLKDKKLLMKLDESAKGGKPVLCDDLKEAFKQLVD